MQFRSNKIEPVPKERKLKKKIILTTHRNIQEKTNGHSNLPLLILITFILFQLNISEQFFRFFPLFCNQFFQIATCQYQDTLHTLLFSHLYLWKYLEKIENKKEFNNNKKKNMFTHHSNIYEKANGQDYLIGSYDIYFISAKHIILIFLFILFKKIFRMNIKIQITYLNQTFVIAAQQVNQ